MVGHDRRRDTGEEGATVQVRERTAEGIGLRKKGPK